VASVVIDLHTHSSRSDGTDRPGELVTKAAAAGLSVVALTDHDTFDGWAEATEQAEREPVRLVVGVEVSCRLESSGVHVLAYLPDPTEPALVAELERIREGRRGRVPLMVENLRREGLEIGVDDVFAQAGPGVAPGRPHVADVLVAKGYAKDRPDAFRTWLSEGRPGYATRYAPDPETAVRLIVAAGGAPLLAHPRGRASGPLLTDEVIARLADAGLAGVEVDHRDHDRETRLALRALARDLDLVATGSSDYHGLGKTGHPLGGETTAPEELDRLLDRARANAEASGRPTPAVVGA